MHAKREKETDGAETGGLPKRTSRKVPVDRGCTGGSGSLRPPGRRDHRARRLAAHSEKATPPPVIPRGAELRTLAHVPVGNARNGFHSVRSRGAHDSFLQGPIHPGGCWLKYSASCGDCVHCALPRHSKCRAAISAP